MLGLLLKLGLHGAAAIDKFVKDRDYLSSPAFYDQEGRAVYIDSSGNHYINGEKVITEYDYKNKKLIEVGQRTRTVYNDPEEKARQRMVDWSERYKQESIEKGNLAYRKYNFEMKCFLTCEISTDRYISQLKGKKDGTYLKFYLPCNAKNKTDVEEGDIGVQITQEEYDKLNIFDGTHFASDLYRYVPVLRNGKVIYRNR